MSVPHVRAPVELQKTILVLTRYTKDVDIVVDVPYGEGSNRVGGL